MSMEAEANKVLLEMATALYVLTGAMAWWREGSEEEDDMYAKSADVVLDGLSDADKVAKVSCVTGLELRDQVTVEQAEELDRERKLRRFGRRN